MVVLKSFFDGSGKSADRHCGFLTLVGYAAPHVVWPAFEAKWESVLARHGETSIHLNEQRYRDMPVLVGELLESIELASHFGMRTVAATVNLGAYRRLSEIYLSPGRICVEFCINELLRQADSLSCFFDRGEEFYKEVNRLWNSDQGSDAPEWPELAKVSELGQVRDQRNVPGIQAADLLAWHINRSLTKSDHGVELALAANRTPGVFKLFDVAALFALKKP